MRRRDALASRRRLACGTLRPGLPLCLRAQGGTMTLFSRLLYTLISIALLGASVMLIGVAVWRTATGYWTGENALDGMLDAIGLIIIAVAVADVGKFLFEEEVVADREMRRPAEARGVEAIGRRLDGLRPAGGAFASVDAALAMIEAARHRCPDDRIFFMEVQEEGSPRRSFDINFYSAGLRVASVEEPVRRMAAAYAIAPPEIDGLLSRIGGEPLGHLSGGMGRDGRDFATLYFGVAARRGAGRG